MSHSKEISQQRSLTANNSHSKEISQQRLESSHSKEVSQQRSLTSKKSYSKEIKSHSKRSQEISQPCTKALFQFWMELSHEIVAFTSSTFKFEGSLAQKLRFHIFNLPLLREVSHKMRFWEIADARNAVFWSTERVSEDEWGFAARRLRNAFG